MRVPSLCLTLILLASLLASCNDDPACATPDGRVDSVRPDQTAGLDATRSDVAPRDGSTGGGWAVSAGGEGFDGIWNVVVDHAGDLVVSGFFSGTATFGATTLTAQDVSVLADSSFIAKLDSTGKVLWAKPIDGVPTHWNSDYDGLAVDASGNIYYAGQFQGTATFGATTLTAQGDYDLFVAKLDPNGNVLWAVSAGGPGRDAANALAVSAGGAITIAGSFADTASFGATSLTARGKSDIFVARLDPSGGFDWSVSAGSDAADQDEWAIALVLDNAGNAYVTGSAGPAAEFGAKIFAAKSGPGRAFVARVDPTGAFDWVTEVGASSAGNAIARDAAGVLYVSSAVVLSWLSKMDFSIGAVSRLNETGACLGTRMLPASGTLFANRLTVDAQGNSTVVGYFRGAGVLGTTMITSTGNLVNAFVARLDPQLNVIDGEQIPIGGAGDWDSAIGVARGPGGETYVTGSFSGAATFHGTTLKTKTVQQDGFVWSTGP